MTFNFTLVFNTLLMRINKLDIFFVLTKVNKSITVTIVHTL